MLWVVVVALALISKGWSSPTLDPLYLELSIKAFLLMISHILVSS